MTRDLDLLCINTIRTLSMDAVQKANSGHPGTPMALAPVAYGMWKEFLRYDADDPEWPDRDRFVLSCGHASMLVYSLLHLAGVKRAPGASELSVPLDEIKRFRQLDSRCPGHPEHGLTAGVETTTGPLGQGTGNSVGMAIAALWLAAKYDRPGFELFKHRVYAIVSDGDMMEGIGSEAASTAGHLALANLCWVYDNNRITIEGKTDLAFTEDVGKRFEAYGWDVAHVTDANDLAALRKAYAAFEAPGRKRPYLIIVDTHIGFGSPNKQDSHSAHGEALGEEEVKLTKRAYGWPEDAKFLVPDGVREHFHANLGARGKKLADAWRATFAKYATAHPKEAAELRRLLDGELPERWDKSVPTFPADAKGLATRDASGKVLNAIAQSVPWLLGGSADLAPSTKTLLTFDGAGHFSAKDRGGRNFHFGVREHAMGAITNGMALSKLRPYGATFLIFLDYMKPAVRLSALMELPVIQVFTHDSIGVGEDGPTHQPIEQLATLRATPGVLIVRPADANETAEAWKLAIASKKEPVCLALTRQALPTVDRTKYSAASGLARGAYILADAPRGEPQVVLMASGSEVSLCLAAFEALASEGIAARVVSMPCFELFERQSDDYKAKVLRLDVQARVAVEAASPFGWSKYVGAQGTTLCMTGFGASAPLADLQKHFGFTKERVVDAAKRQLSLATA